MNDIAPPRVSAEARDQEISVLLGRLAGALSSSVPVKVYTEAISPLLVSAACLAEEPPERDSLFVRRARADRALDRLRKAAAAVAQ